METTHPQKPAAVTAGDAFFLVIKDGSRLAMPTESIARDEAASRTRVVTDCAMTIYRQTLANETLRVAIYRNGRQVRFEAGQWRNL